MDVTKLKIPEKTALFINESICPPLQSLYYLVRQVQKNGKINSYNFWKGKPSIKMHKDGQSKAIGNIRDLYELSLGDDIDNINEFYKTFETFLRFNIIIFSLSFIFQDMVDICQSVLC